MVYNFSEKEKRFILDCIREDDLIEAEEYMISLNGEIDKINDYYLDLLFKAQNYILEENDKNVADFNLLTLYSENLQKIYLDISKLPKKDILKVISVADEVFEMTIEIELGLKEDKKDIKKKKKRLQMILDNIISNQ